MGKQLAFSIFVRLCLILYQLNNNNISCFREVDKLSALIGMKTIYLENNPICASTNTYVARLKHLFPQLTQIDAEILTDL